MLGIYCGSRANFGRLKGLFDLLIDKGYPFRIIGGNFRLDFEYLSYITSYIEYDSKQNLGLLIPDITKKMYSFLDMVDNYIDSILVHGDRYEVYATAIAAFLKGIPIYHTEGGEVSGCLDNTFRNMISCMATTHLVPSQLSADRLAATGYTNLHVVGSLALDPLNSFIKDFNNYNAYVTEGHILCVYNPVTDRHEDPIPYMNALAKLSKDGFKLIIAEPCRDPGYLEIMDLYKQYGLLDYVVYTLQHSKFIEALYGSYIMIGNSSSGIKEAAFLRKPYILVGSRQNSRETEGNVFRASMDEKEITDLVAEYFGKVMWYKGTWGYGDAAEKIYKILKEG
jgi:UDP-hydrolysing UDP-N-acetyl-D-glucosamine 2-epimerase